MTSAQQFARNLGNTVMFSFLAGFLADPIGKASEFYDHLVETGAARILSFAVASKFISWHFKRKATSRTAAAASKKVK